MRRHLVLLTVVAAACHTDSAVAPVDKGGGGFTDAKNMNVGEVRVLTPSQLPNGIELTANAAASDYLLVVANTSPTLDVPATYVVKGDLQSGLPPRSALVPSNLVAVDGGAPDLQEGADARIRAYEREHLLLGRAGAASRPALGARNAFLLNGSGPVTIGQQVSIKVPNEKSSDLCTNFVQTIGTVKAISNKAIIVLDNQADPAFTTDDFNAIGAEFDNVTYPTDSDYFGKPTDFDANGKIVLYYTPEVNKLSTTQSQSFVAGFFFAGDFFDPAKTVAQGGCPQSNQGEIFYLLAPDPNQRFGKLQTTANVRQGTRGTVAHEFQHMINAGNRFLTNAPSFEAVWLDEGLAHTAEDAVGRTVKGFSDFQTLTDALLYPAGTTRGSQADNDYQAYFGQNISRFKFWLAKPDTSSPLSKHADQNLASRGAIWALLRWTGDQYSGGNFRAYTRKLAAGPDTGVKNLTGAVGQPIDTLLAGWLVANYSDHTGIPGLPAKYNYVGYNMRDVVGGFVGGSPAAYPLAVTTLLSGSTLSTQNLPGSGTYYKIAVPAGAGRTILVENPGGGTVSYPGAHFYVLRID